jgi:lipopolysaccharide transport system ATP-binding protein
LASKWENKDFSCKHALKSTQIEFEIAPLLVIFTPLKPILEIKQISKKFNIQANHQPYLSLRESLLSFSRARSKKEDFWALKDVSFTVEQGDTIGIVGKNGAGKSTLLKILSKITPPTSGSIICRGRIASLLEVGTGFHPELSGKENIFMNGSILGMRKAEIQKNFDAIVDFSGVEKFIQTPLKHYSSGMQLRLAFAVAAFLENEILVIDEVLAVGDAEFQKKCINKMNDVSRSGRTILFVSHSVNALKSLCKRGILLRNGTVETDSDMNAALKNYLNVDIKNGSHYTKTKKSQGKDCEILEVKLTNRDGDLSSYFNVSESIAVEITWENKKGLPVTPNIELHNLFGHKIFWTTDSVIDINGKKKAEQGTYKSTAVIPANLLNSGEYLLHVGLDLASPRTNYDCLINEIFFIVKDSLEDQSLAKGGFSFNSNEYALLPVLNWKYEKVC